MLQRELLSVSHAYAESHRNIFNYSKTVCMTFKPKSSKSTVTLLLTHQNRRQKVFNRGFTFMREGFGFVRGSFIL